MRAGAGAAAEGASGGRSAACRGAGGSGRDGADGEGEPRGRGWCEELPAGPAARGCVRLLHTCHRCAARGGAGRRLG